SLDALLRKASSDRRVPATTAARFAALVTLYPFLRGDLVVLERGARHAAALAERAGDHLLAANAHKRLGYALVEQRRPDEATRHQDRALAAFRAAGDREGEAGMLNSIGRRLLYEARSHPDRYADARRYLLGSLAVARETGRGTAQVTALGNLGQLEHRAGRPDEARAYLTEALALSQKLGAAQLETVVAGSLGGVLADLGHHTEAVRQHEHALHVSRALADRSRETVALHELAETYLVAGLPELAADCAGRALDLHGRYGGPDAVEADVRVALGRALAALGRRTEAREEWSRALAVLDAADPVGAAEVRALLSR
ncbi:MAG TPA: tetratricopeptide repeat protein, partial [Actinocatenispora sp.]